MESHSFETLFQLSLKCMIFEVFLPPLKLERERPEFSLKLLFNPQFKYMALMYQHHPYRSLFKRIATFNTAVRISCQTNLPTTCCACRIDLVQWNLDLTKSLGTGQICLLNRGFVISKTSI